MYRCVSAEEEPMPAKGQQASQSMASKMSGPTRPAGPLERARSVLRHTKALLVDIEDVILRLAGLTFLILSLIKTMGNDLPQLGGVSCWRPPFSPTTCVGLSYGHAEIGSRRSFNIASVPARPSSTPLSDRKPEQYCYRFCPQIDTAKGTDCEMSATEPNGASVHCPSRR